MVTYIRIVGRVWLLALSLHAAAAQTPDEHASRFRDFFAPAIGAWPVEVVDYDAAGKVEYRALQLRELRFSVGGRYVRESVLLRDARGRTMEGGVMLHGLDGQTGVVRTFGFWGMPTDGLFVTSRFATAGDALRLQGAGTDYPKGKPVKTRSDIGWDKGQLVWRSYHVDENGREYPDHVLTYQVAPVEVIRFSP